MPDSETSVPSFHGHFLHGIDESRRVMIPAKWRPKDARIVFRVLAWPIRQQEYLLVLPPQRWQVVIDKLKTESLLDGEVAVLERWIGGMSAPLTLDRVGRFNLPVELAEAVGIEKEAQFVGRLDKFEIWSPARFQAMARLDRDLAASVAAKIKL